MGLREVMLEELRDLYIAENQLLKALPRLAKAAEDDELKQAFSGHLEETKGQVERLKQVLLLLQEKPTGRHCNGMEGLIEEGKIQELIVVAAESGTSDDDETDEDDQEETAKPQVSRSRK